MEIFDITKPTCLRPDWSCKGVGYFLFQKHCSCKRETPDCCRSGWRVTLAGSRFLQQAEQRYAAIEGEALAVSWALEQTKYFTQGCNKLLVVTDHQPLVKLFGDRTLDAIPNTRLFRLKQRTLPWSFRIRYLPGKTNHAADATSRHPSPTGEIGHEDKVEALINAAIGREAEEITTLSWDALAEATKADPVLTTLGKAIREKFTIQYAEVRPYFKYRNALYMHDGVIMMNDRAVIPQSLRPMVLKTLHSAHQGVLGMGSRARAVLFWPGMSKDIEKVRQNCIVCDLNAPSQAHLPTVPANPSQRPFDEIYADFFFNLVANIS